MDDRQMAKADFVTAILLILSSLFIMVATLFFPRYGEWGGIYSNPGFVPFLLAFTLILLSIYLLFRSLKKGGHKVRLIEEAILNPLRTDKAKRFLVCLFLFVGYYVLLGRIPFLLDTTLYLFLSILIFGKGKWMTALVISLASSFTVYLLFYRIFLVPLP